MVKLYLDQQGRTVQRFKDNFLGNDWYRTFMERHKDDNKERVGQNIKRKRAEVSHAILDEYFDNLLAEIEGLPPTNIINFDETNVQDDPGKRKLVFKRGCKYPERLLNSSKAAISIMFSGSASGDVLPAYVVYKSINMWDSWTTGGPPKTRYNNTPSGWFDMRSFEDWFKTVIMPYQKKVSGRLIVIGDNLSSHHSVEVVELCHRNNIGFVCLPAYSTHICQPLDVAFFSPIKKFWRKVLSDWKLKQTRRDATLRKDEFPKLFSVLLDAMKPTIKSNLMSGFKKCGIFPFDPNAVKDRIPAPSCQPEGSNPHNANSTSDAQKINDSISDIVMQTLQDMRYGSQSRSTTGTSTGTNGTSSGNSNASTGSAKRRRRVNVNPGRSITSDNFGQENLPGTSNSNALRASTSTSIPRRTSNPRRTSTSTSTTTPRKTSTCRKTSTLTTISIGADNYQCLGEEDGEEEVMVPIRRRNLARGDWILGKFDLPVRKNKVYYVGQVITVLPEEEGESVIAKFLRRKKEKTFVWPENHDVCEIEMHQIVMNLPNPVDKIAGSRAGEMTFLHDFKHYYNYLK